MWAVIFRIQNTDLVGPEIPSRSNETNKDWLWVRLPFFIPLQTDLDLAMGTSLGGIENTPKDLLIYRRFVKISNNNMHIAKYQTNTEEDVDYSKSYGLKGIAASTKTTSCVHQSEILGQIWILARNHPVTRDKFEFHLLERWIAKRLMYVSASLSNIVSQVAQ